MHVQRLAVAVLIGSIFIAFCCQAQQHKCEQVVFASVLDGKTHSPIVGLTAANFRAHIKGESMQVTSAAISSPKRIVIVLDGSDSMRGAYPWKWKEARKAAADILAAAPVGVDVGLISFAGKEQVLLPLGSDREAIRTKLASLEWAKAEGEKHDIYGTPLLDTLHDAIQMLTPTEPGDSVFLISDGGDTRSRMSAHTIERELANTGIRVFAMLVSEFPLSDMKAQEMELPWMLAAAGKTGGDWGQIAPAMTPGQPDTLLVETEVVVKQVFEQSYKLTLQTPQMPKQHKWELNLVDADGMKRKLRLIYPPMLWPCSGRGSTVGSAVRK